MRKKLGLLSILLLMSCTEQKKLDTLVFATSADYPPFEYQEDGQITGLDIDLAHALSQEMNKKIEIKDMQFNAVFESLNNGSADAVIATIVATEERAKLFDFSDVYYKETLAVITKTANNFDDEKLQNKKIAYQLGAVNIENWIKANIKDAELISINNANQAIESLKAGHVDAVVVDGAQAKSFIDNNSDLEYKVKPSENPGYVIAVKKGSALKEELNKALSKLASTGKLEEVISKWMKK
jgi:polar amino acid transport system substrate-binding protein